MANNPKKGPFQASIDLNQIPGYRSRFASLDSLIGPAKINMQPFEPTDLSIAVDAENLREKLGSHQDIRSNPGIILRRRGMQK